MAVEQRVSDGAATEESQGLKKVSEGFQPQLLSTSTSEAIGRSIGASFSLEAMMGSMNICEMGDDMPTPAMPNLLFELGSKWSE